MKNCNILFLFIILGINSSFIFSATDELASPVDILDKKIENTIKDKFDFSKADNPSLNSGRTVRSGIKNIDFKYKDVDLVDVINEIAEAKGENIILPSQEPIKSKLTINIPEKLSIQEAWDILNTILDVAGYAVSQATADMSKIVKKDENLVKNAFRIFKEEQSSIFVDTDYQEIPDTDERIIFLCYFDNIQVPQEGASGDGQNVIQEVIQIYTGKNVTSASDRGTASFRFIPGANGVVIVDKASNIRSMMKIFSELDKAGFKESLEKIKLENVAAETVAKMFTDENNGIIGKKQKNTYRLGKKRKSKKNYFDKETKVVAEPKSNSLILMGNKESIDRIKEFIYKFIDIPIEGGRSVLHRKKLDYLDCDKLKEVLTKIVTQTTDENAQARAGGQASGPERFFSEGIKIETDRPKQDGGATPEAGAYKYSGTNSILVAAKNDDWQKIEKLIEDLDKPQKQVIIEILIVDLIMDGNKILGSQTRNPSIAPLFNISQNGGPINIQSAQLAGIQTSACVPPGTCNQKGQTIRADLMQGVNSGDPVVLSSPFTGQAGSTLCTLSDKNGWTWSVLQVLESYKHTKILSHPYIIAVDNKPATVSVGVSKRLQGTVSGTNSGTSSVAIVNVDALIKVDVTPRIGGLDEHGDPSVNLRVSIDINEFEDTSPTVNQVGQNPMNKRKISTNANIKNGEILALGGLIRIDSDNVEGKAPILGRIPIIGSLFFKQRAADRTKTNLTVFIRATVVEPAAMGKIDKYAQDYIDVAKKYSAEGGLAGELRDPITRWFFGSDNTSVGRLEEFTKINQKVISTEEIKFAESKFGPGSNTILAQNDVAKNISQVGLSGQDKSKKDQSGLPENEANKALDNLNASDLSSGDLSHVNASCSDIAEIELKDEHNLDKNAYELFEDANKQDDLLVKANCPVKNSDSCLQQKSDDKLRNLLQEIDNPFIAG